VSLVDNSLMFRKQLQGPAVEEITDTVQGTTCFTDMIPTCGPPSTQHYNKTVL
jgi:hypothetical protein